MACSGYSEPEIDAASVDAAVETALHPASPQPAPSSCKAPRHYFFTKSTVTPIRCYYYPEDGQHLDPWPTTLFSVAIPDAGRAVARLKYRAANNNSDISVGADGIMAYNFSLRIGHAESRAHGENICRGTTTPLKQLIAVGDLTPSANRVSVLANAYVGGCVDGKVVLTDGASLDVWVEDPAPGCRGGDIQFRNEAGVFVWTGAYRPLWGIDIDVFKNSARTKLLTLAATEVNATPTVNICGSETESVTIRHMVNNSAVAQSSVMLAGHTFPRGLVNQTHTLIHTESWISLSALPPVFSVNVFGAASTTQTAVTSGDYGDLNLVTIQLGP